MPNLSKSISVNLIYYAFVKPDWAQVTTFQKAMGRKQGLCDSSYKGLLQAQCTKQLSSILCTIPFQDFR